ncbi:ATP synthase F1 subunit gamma [Mongoliitalea daihaiensis]|uniref:ATP synthase F1 subunit gamma n=1 Tax=Mongoliitalea daihaiensis TaxID=2782006 RepID=UPI001F3578B6|nr:ATP synthase F1 subunit gamma [Mongoliitalea daihaiensis]UJP66292.1 ATP synthase F1 subunit gamma [Mongoliitalea daihaiensis]
MANLKEVKQRITSVTSTQQITKAMKMVAAAKLRRAQDRILKMRPYSQKLTTILNDVVAAMGGELQIAYAEQRPVERVLIVPMTSDKGLCGAFNTNVLKSTTNTIHTKYSNAQVTILPLGKKSFEFFSKRGFHVIGDYYEVFMDLSYDKVRDIATYAMDSFISGEYDKVVLVYNHFRNVATQEIQVEQFLPMEGASLESKGSMSIDYILEPTKEYVIEELVPVALKTQFYKAVLDSNASEHGARMTSMDKATENAGELLKELKLMYNRTRQAAITNEILEIVAGANALEGS